MLCLQNHQNQYLLFPKKLLNYQNQYPKTDLPENIDIISAISDINKIISPNQFDNVDGDNNIVEEQTSDNEVKYIPAPAEVPFPLPIHLREARKQKLKQIREQKERYKKNANKKTIKFLNKKNAADLLKEHREKQKANKKVNKKIKPLLGVEDRRAREFVNSKKNEIYRRNARIKAIKKLINKKRKLRSVIKSDNNFSDTETIQYAGPCRDTS